MGDAGRGMHWRGTHPFRSGKWAGCAIKCALDLEGQCLEHTSHCRPLPGLPRQASAQTVLNGFMERPGLPFHLHLLLACSGMRWLAIRRSPELFRLVNLPASPVFGPSVSRSCLCSSVLFACRHLPAQATLFIHELPWERSCSNPALAPISLWWRFTACCTCTAPHLAASPGARGVALQPCPAPQEAHSPLRKDKR